MQLVVNCPEHGSRKIVSKDIAKCLTEYRAWWLLHAVHIVADEGSPKISFKDGMEKMMTGHFPPGTKITYNGTDLGSGHVSIGVDPAKLIPKKWNAMEDIKKRHPYLRSTVEALEKAVEDELAGKGKTTFLPSRMMGKTYATGLAEKLMKDGVVNLSKTA